MKILTASALALALAAGGGNALAQSATPVPYEAVDAMPLDMPPITGDREADVLAIMTKVNQRIEDVVKEHPEQWLWMHDRCRWAREKGLLRDD